MKWSEVEAESATVQAMPSSRVKSRGLSTSTTKCFASSMANVRWLQHLLTKVCAPVYSQLHAPQCSWHSFLTFSWKTQPTWLGLWWCDGDVNRCGQRVSSLHPCKEEGCWGDMDSKNSPFAWHCVCKDTGTCLCLILHWQLQHRAGQVVQGHYWSSSACAERSSLGRQWNPQVRRGLTHLLHKEIHLLDVPQRIQFKLGVTVHRCLQGNAPQYLVDCCKSTTDVASRQLLRSASHRQLIVPRHRLTNGRWAFSVAGPTAWNSLQDYLRDPSLSKDTFRRSLKTYLFALYRAHSALEVLRNALYFLLTYLLTYL